jgi:hypothetical protein
MSLYDLYSSLNPGDEEERLLEALKMLLANIDSTVEPTCHVEYTPKDLCDMLMANGHWDTIEKLKHVERGTKGFGTVVITPAGFSDDEETHKAVLDWLHKKKVHVFNPSREIACLEDACSWKHP